MTIEKIDTCSTEPFSVGRCQVYKTDRLGLLFIMSRGFGGKLRRLYGDIYSCEACKAEYFRPNRDTKRGFGIYCSVRCSKLGDRNPTRRREQRNPRYTADTEFGRLIRSEGRCVNCGRTDSLECAHGFSRRYLWTRCDPRNAFCLCVWCHKHFTVRPLEWDGWLRKRWGMPLYEELRVLALKHGHPDWNDVVASIRAML